MLTWFDTNSSAILVVLGLLLLLDPLRKLLFKRPIDKVAIFTLLVSLGVIWLGFRGSLQQEVRLSHVERVTAPRQLSDDQKQILQTWISDFPGQRVTIGANTAGNDSHELAEQIFSVFVAARWRLAPGSDNSPGVIDFMRPDGPEPGDVMILVADTAHLSAAAHAVLNAFGKMGLSPSIQASVVPQDSIEIDVLPRPPR